MLNIKGDLKPITKHLNKVQKKQIPFATANAINSVLFGIQKAEKAQMPKKLDNPTPYTMKAFKVNKAKKTQLVGEIFVMPQKYKYLKYAIEGGTRTGNVSVPYTKTGNIKLNKYGNIKGKKGGLVKNQNQFIGKIKGISGVWERGHYSKKGNFSTKGKSKSTAVRLLVAFEPTVNYKKRCPFYEIAEGYAKKNLQKELAKAFARAKATAKG